MHDPHENPIKEAWILCLILGIIMINFPFIHIFNTGRPILGIPGLVLYFFIGWPLSILVIWLFVHQMERKPDDDIENEGKNDL